VGIFSIVFSIFLSVVLIGGGYLCKSAANGGINDYAGYRTKLSKKNADTWKEGNTYGGKVLIICGLVYAVISTVCSIIFYNQALITLIEVSLGVIPVILIGVYISEKHLKNIFDSEGNRK
jgi:uncharacterized membrane protein